MKTPPRLLIASVLFIAALLPRALAGDQFATLTLKDGRVLHDVVVLNVHALTLNVRAAEGLIQINKTSLPPEIAARYPVDHSAAAAEEKAAEVSAEVSRKLEEARRRQALEAQKTRAKEIEAKTLSNGCRILSFTQFGLGSAIVEVRNETDLPVTLPGKSIVGRTANNSVFVGLWLKNANENSRRSIGTYTIPGNATVRIPVQFVWNRQADIVEVFWQKS